MIRAISVLVTAILTSSPGMPKAEAARYAKVLNEVAQKHDFDPLTAVAIIHFETHWRPGLVSDDGEDYGLGQVRGRFLSACRADEDPVGAPSDACKAAKAQLLVGENNIRHMAAIISANRDLCREKVGSAKAFQWLAGYQGRNHPSEDKWCQPGEGTWRVLAYRQELIDKLIPKPKPPPVARRPIASKPAASAPAARATAAPVRPKSVASRTSKAQIRRR